MSLNLDEVLRSEFRAAYDQASVLWNGQDSAIDVSIFSPAILVSEGDGGCLSGRLACASPSQHGPSSPLPDRSWEDVLSQ